ncbi:MULTISPECIES: PP2C family serine/threonine-protein phosphatase [unclassified Thiocapsa]|uniref:PP2C family serine/threonine-protein phosphatase n=1 Tax=unclassified Thiocapsa TaxID=2641286 RepID=UPI0035B0DB0D
MAWRHSGVSVRGSWHLKTATPCQDAHAILDRADLLVLAVADGAGSARHADLGATLATAHALTWFADGWRPPADAAAWEADLRDLLAELRAALTAEAGRLGCSTRDLACTFLLALVTPTALIGIQVGDGAIVYRPHSAGAADALALLIVPSRGEYINETVFLISETCLQEAQFAYRDGAPEALALFSDGLQMLALDMTGQPLARPPRPLLRPTLRLRAG